MTSNIAVNGILDIVTESLWSHVKNSTPTPLPVLSCVRIELEGRRRWETKLPPINPSRFSNYPST